MPTTYTPLASDEHSETVCDGDSSDRNDSDSSPVAPGVQGIEAVTAAWTTGALVAAYVLIWLTYFVEGTLSSTTAILAPYVTSAFARHALTPSVGILSSVVGGVTNLTLARVLDVFGRPQGYAACIVLATAGLVTMATCRSVAAYAAAQVLQTVGNSGLQYSLTVFVADTSSLRNRGLMQALVSSPNLITCFLAAPLSGWFLAGPGWRAAFGSFAVLVPAVTLPLFVLLLSSFRKAQRLGLADERPSSSSGPCRSLRSSLAHHARQFDAVGLVLLSTGVALVLLPFHLYALQGWHAPLVLASFVGGALSIVAFAVWERRSAAATLVPYTVLLDRTVLGACLLSAALFASYWCWNSFFGSYLQVVHDLDVATASYVVQSYTVCSVVCAIAVGLLVHYTGRFKPVCLWLGIPLSVLGTSLLLHVCRTEAGLAWVVVCQILVSVAAGTIMVCAEVAILAAASHHQQAAVCLALLGMFGNVGGAVGLTAAAAIWQAVFPDRLARYLPADALPHRDEIYASLAAQLAHPVGSPTRRAIQHAYRDAQVDMLAAGTAIWAAGFLGVLLWRDINVINAQQSKGHVW